MFFSDHCECEKSISPDDVVRKVAVEFFCLDGKIRNPGIPSANFADIDAEFFVRQKYFSVEDNIHVQTLTPDDVASETPCPCQRTESLPIYDIGDFVLVAEEDRLQPYKLEGYGEKFARLRKLHRRKEVEGIGKKNELICTEEIMEVCFDKIVRKCIVVEVEQGEDVPRLANWGGSCDWFFFRTNVKAEEVQLFKRIERISIGGETTETGSLTKTNDPQVERKTLMNEGFQMAREPEPILSPTQFREEQPIPTQISTESTKSASIAPMTKRAPDGRKLRALDLFCGGGNFGRGVADGGAIQPRWYTS